MTRSPGPPPLRPQNITLAYAAPSLPFFLTLGPMTDASAGGVALALAQGAQAGLSVHFVNMSGIHCDGCAGHPGVNGHAAMAAAQAPVIASVLGW